MAKKLVRVNRPVKVLLFIKFKKAFGLKVFMLKYKDERERNIYKNILFALQERNFLTYAINSYSIQIFLTDLGRKTVDEQDNWENEEPDETDEEK